MTVKTVDFSNVKDGGNFNRSRIPAGDYLAKIVKVEDAVSKKDDAFQFLFTIQIQKRPSSKFPYYCKLQENQLWKLRNLLIAGGLTVPKRKVKVDPNKLVGRRIGVTIEDDEYEGREQSQIAGVFPAAELADGELVTEPEEAGEIEIEVEADDMDDLVGGDDEDETDRFAGMSRTELKQEIAKYNPNFRAKKSQTDDDLRDILTDAIADATPADEDEDEDEEEAPAPVKKKAAPAKKKLVVDPDEVSDEELEELDIDDL